MEEQLDGPTGVEVRLERLAGRVKRLEEKQAFLYRLLLGGSALMVGGVFKYLLPRLEVLLQALGL